MPENRFSNSLEWVLKKAGWFPGRDTEATLAELDFTMHSSGIKFLREFGGLFIGGAIVTDGYYINAVYEKHKQIITSIIPSCLPLGFSWFWCEGELWMDELGQIYQANYYKMVLVSDTIEDALEMLLIRQKEIPKNAPKWYLTPQNQ